ncbi:MAG: thiamine biosynthesis protein ThiI, partial [Natronomonas sp.]
MNSVVVRYGELGTKSPSVRRRMEEQLRANVAAALDDRGISGRVERTDGRLIIRTADAGEAATAAADLPGVVSASPAREVAPDADAIYETMVALARDRSFDTYAVRASRARDDHPFTSPQLEREGGAAIGEAVAAGVDLDDPDVTFEADVR